MTPAEIAKQIEDLKLALAKATTEANKAARADAIAQAKVRGRQGIDEANKASDNLVASAKAKGLAMVQSAIARATTMLDRAEKGLSENPSNSQAGKPRFGRRMPDGSIVPLGRGRPSPSWELVDLSTVHPSQISADTTALGMAVALADDTKPVAVVPVDDGAVTMVFRGSGHKPEVIPNV